MIMALHVFTDIITIRNLIHFSTMCPNIYVCNAVTIES